MTRCERTASLDAAFFPRSVAIAGVGVNNSGKQYLDSLLSSGFKGRIYPMNPNGGEILGLRVYANVKDIAGPVDYVISCLPAHLVPQLVNDCAEKGTKVISLFTAGFSELGTDAGRQLEAEIAVLARANGVRVLGPNCMGVYCPRSGLSFVQDFPKEPGKVALVCQSGGNAIYFVRVAAARGVRFSKVISYGNGCDISESELFQYLADDADTEIVAAYIEGVRDGQRFYEALRHLAGIKPTIVLKAGGTPAGARTAASHTGSLAGSDEVWSSLLRQAGAIRVQSLDQMIDLVVTFLLLPLPDGRMAGMVSIGGGASVLATDVCAANHFVVPALPQAVGLQVRSLIRSEAGLVLSNPIELNMPPDASYNATRCLLTQDRIDLLFAACVFGQHPWPIFDDLADRFCDTIVRIHADVPKPLAAVLLCRVPQAEQQFRSLQERLCHAGLPVYHSIEGACTAIDSYLSFHDK